MNVKKKIFKRSCSFLSGFMAMNLFLQPVSAKTPSDTLVMAWNIDGIMTFDPAQLNEATTSEIILNVCDSLVDSSIEDAGKVVPRLAKSWDVSGGDDSTVITFHLRDNLKFSDGRSANAHDLVWSMKRVVHLKMAAAATFNEYGITTETVDDAIQALDDTTLVMKFNKPYPAELILNNIGTNHASILLDRETLMKHEEDGDMGNRYLVSRAACVGPYTLANWRHGEAALLHSNPHYWGDAPKLKKILIRHVAEPGTQRLMLQKNDVDVARNLGPEALSDLQKTTDIRIEKVLVPAIFYWGFNMTNPIFSNEKVMLAMRYLIDYDGLGKTVLKGIGIPRASFLPVGTLGSLNEEEGQPFKVDVEKAKQLLTEAGYPNGFETSVLVSATPTSLSIVESIQDSVAKAGIRLKIERLAGTQLFSKVYARAYDTAFVGWSNESSDSHTMATRLIYNPDNRFEARNTAYPSWQSAYLDENMNRKVEEALFEKDSQSRAQRYVDLQREFMQKGPYVFVFQKYNVVAVAPVIKKWVQNGAPRIFYNLIEK
ncbi:ABC transporter substrate-binding protein [Bartonella sp. F02]|uniref:ABC transporter substrate-binding protein n=1 Tax=Bartonella sp. F02 TaxID=2967262 RepID=UPI0022A9ED59|nr:ABC transporter substrate-binding protein [Bartonella sp. F02]MCZ2328741.1 ABC transporter substrate-binding protein [Bartonella sp. F02]